MEPEQESSGADGLLKGGAMLGFHKLHKASGLEEMGGWVCPTIPQLGRRVCR